MYSSVINNKVYVYIATWFTITQVQLPHKLCLAMQDWKNNTHGLSRSCRLHNYDILPLFNSCYTVNLKLLKFIQPSSRQIYQLQGFHYHLQLVTEEVSSEVPLFSMHNLVISPLVLLKVSSLSSTLQCDFYCLFLSTAVVHPEK